MQEHQTISRNLHYPPGLDYDQLRAEGLALIQKMGSRIWTDYNIHDPGITLLETLAFALTDLGYRLQIPMVDRMALPHPRPEDHHDQSFFTPAEILPINPLTEKDYRKLLVDIPGVKNAWIHPKACACEDMVFYAHCLDSALKYTPSEHPLWVRGLYDVDIEFDRDPQWGDLNTGWVFFPFRFSPSDPLDPPVQAQAQLRFPHWRELEQEKEDWTAFRQPRILIDKVKVGRISGNRDAADTGDIADPALPRALRKALYVDLSIEFRTEEGAAPQTLELKHRPLLFWFQRENDRKKLRVEAIRDRLETTAIEALVRPFHQGLIRADQIMDKVRSRLHAHRNLAEDFCGLSAVPVETFSVCADLDLEPQVDMEKWLAQAYYEIERYLNPRIPVRGLFSLLEEGHAVEDIFSGPRLENGFILDDDLESADRRDQLQTSDLFNLLMGIEGVKSIRNFVWVRLDEQGNPTESQPWTMEVSPGHIPRFSLPHARFLVFKDGLPFLPRQKELLDGLSVLESEAMGQARGPMDLEVPQGQYRPAPPFLPLSSTLPPAYGLGPEGLPPGADAERKLSQVQLRGYLLVFEQIYAALFAQSQSLRQLFSRDPSVDQTYFGHWFTPEEMPGIEDLFLEGEGETKGPEALRNLLESPSVFLSRRNRFLDHLLSRFAENMGDYALMLHAYSEESARGERGLIRQKADFLRDLPFLSRNRARALDITAPAPLSSPASLSGLERRIQRLLGLLSPRTYFELYEEEDTDGLSFERRWRLKNEEGRILLSSSTRYVDPDPQEADRKAWEEIDQVIEHMTNPGHYLISEKKKWGINLVDGHGEIIATRKQPFDTEEEAELAVEEILEFAQKIYWADKVMVIEHVLLRPRLLPSEAFPQGDPFLPVCLSSDCENGGEADPYSFRITLVLNGSSGLANQGIAFRRFAESTIRREVPAHIGLRLCWIREEQMERLWPAYRRFLTHLNTPDSDPGPRHQALKKLLEILAQLKSIYPPASLHDCVDGNDENRVYLNQTII